MKELRAAERAIKAICHFRKEISGSVSVDAGDFAASVARSVQYWANGDDACVIARAPKGGEPSFSLAGNAPAVLAGNDRGVESLLESAEFRCHDRNDGTIVLPGYRSWLELPISGKKETHLVAIVARKGGRFSGEESDAGKALASYFSAALRDTRSRNRKATEIAREAERRILVTTQGSLGRKTKPYPGYFQLSDYGARAGSDLAGMWRSGDDGILACACDVTATDSDRHLALVYLDAWFSILSRTTLRLTEIVERLNADLLARQSECYASLAGVRYSGKDGKAEIAGAGNATAVYFRHDSLSAEVLSFGPACGVRKDVAIRSHALEPKTGDVICLCTDGLTAARKTDGGLVGAETVAETVRKHYYLAAEDLAAKVLETIASVSEPGTNEDDRTVQILKIL